MDLLEDPEIKKKYEKCKYIVKAWESRFKKEHKRLPSKLDIREADVTVKNAYKKYFQLKTAALEQSFVDVDGFDDENNAKPEAAPISNNTPKHEETICEQETETIIKVPDEVWGAHLNHKIKEKVIEEDEEKPKINSSITKKLFCGSKFTKRNPRKSLSFSQRHKSDLNIDKQFSLSQPVPSSEVSAPSQYENTSFSSQSELSETTSFQIKNVKDTVLSQPVNIIQRMLDTNMHKPLKTVDIGWLGRVIDKTDETMENPNLPTQHCDSAYQGESAYSEPTKFDYDSEDIIVDSEDETNSKEITPLHIAKKKKMNESLQNFGQISIPHIPNSENTMAQPKTVATIQKEEDLLKRTSVSNPPPVNKASQIASENVSDISSPLPESNISKPKPAGRKKVVQKRIAKTNQKKKKPQKVSSKVDEPNKSESPRRSLRKTKVKVSLQEFSSDEDVFHTDDEDPEYDVDEHKEKNKYKSLDSDEDIGLEKETKPKNFKSQQPKSKTKRNMRKSDMKDDETDEVQSYELEFSIKPRKVAPRYSSIKEIIRETKSIKNDSEETENSNVGTPKTKIQQAKENFEKKIASGNLNDNFVRINIKKKVFVRGKHGRSFSKFKKSQWKTNKAKCLSGPEMDMGGCDGGMLTCFQCGEIGHFARNCKATKGDGFLPLNAVDQEDECPYPTLEEVSQMSHESGLNVRTPKFVLKESNSDVIKEGFTDDNSCIKPEKDKKIDEDVFNDDIDMDNLLEEAEKLEEYAKKLDVTIYMDNIKMVEPYYALSDDNDIIETPKEVFVALQQFGHSSFRAGQEQAVMRILSGKSTLVTLSTGSGKSLCYQLPAYLYSKRESCISLIVSPLVSLMDDQVTNIAKFMKAGCLHSNQTKTQREKILEAISDGQLSVLLVSPEAIVAGERKTGFGSFLRKLPPIAFACIDEVHCVSQWSHNFRPSYLMICKVLRESLGVKTILGLTATATKATRDCIIQHLEIPDGEKGIISDIPLPDNLMLTVSRDLMRDQALVGLLRSERFADCRSIIIYCTRRDECERIAGLLRTCFKEEQAPSIKSTKRKRINVQAEPYHAGLSASRRRTIQNSFMSGELRIVVATVAFGMGINKADIRSVIHYNMPSSFESYVQEVGRAGRDGLKAQCHLFLDSQGKDECELRRHIYANSIDRYAIRKLLQKIFVPCSCTKTCPKHEVAFSIESTVRELDIPEENISTLLCYLELHKNKYIQLLSPAYTHCKIVSYGSSLQIRKAAKECLPLAMALALYKSKINDKQNVFEFPIVDLAAAMGWESGICKHKLKNLEWTSVNNCPKRSLLSVNFSNLGFRMLAPGNLTDDQLDEALDTLHNRVFEQETQALAQLRVVHDTLRKVARKSYQACLSENVEDSDIKTEIRGYFSSPDPLKSVEVAHNRKFNEEQLVSDIHAIINMYRDNSFTGRSIARIFHGIQSPNYPAVIWGRCKFWRSHLAIDFHTIVKIATREIVQTR